MVIIYSKGAVEIEFERNLLKCFHPDHFRINVYFLLSGFQATYICPPEVAKLHHYRSNSFCHEFDTSKMNDRILRKYFKTRSLERTKDFTMLFYQETLHRNIIETAKLMNITSTQGVYKKLSKLGNK